MNEYHELKLEMQLNKYLQSKKFFLVRNIPFRFRVWKPDWNRFELKILDKLEDFASSLDRQRDSRQPES